MGADKLIFFILQGKPNISVTDDTLVEALAQIVDKLKMIYLVIKNDPQFKAQEEQAKGGDGENAVSKKKGFFSTASYENINYNMIGGINMGDIIEKNARRRIYDRDEDDDVSDGDLDDEMENEYSR